MAETTLWWVLAGVVVAIELVTGTIYLLMLSLGLVAGALAAHAGLAVPGQLICAALVSAGSVAGWHLIQQRRRSHGGAPTPGDINLDVGETVMVEHWLPDGTAHVQYRGARWTVIHRAGVSPATGAHRVAEVVGNRLLVDPI